MKGTRNAEDFFQFLAWEAARAAVSYSPSFTDVNQLLHNYFGYIEVSVFVFLLSSELLSIFCNAQPIMQQFPPSYRTEGFSRCTSLFSTNLSSQFCNLSPIILQLLRPYKEESFIIPALRLFQLSFSNLLTIISQLLQPYNGEGFARSRRYLSQSAPNYYTIIPT